MLLFEKTGHVVVTEDYHTFVNIVPLGQAYYDVPDLAGDLEHLDGKYVRVTVEELPVPDLKQGLGRRRSAVHPDSGTSTVGATTGCFSIRKSNLS